MRWCHEAPPFLLLMLPSLELLLPPAGRLALLSSSLSVLRDNVGDGDRDNVGDVVNTLILLMLLLAPLPKWKSSFSCLREMVGDVGRETAGENISAPESPMSSAAAK